MANIQHGAVVVSVPDLLTPPPEAGKLSPQEVARIPKTPHGIGQACSDAADASEKAGPAFVLPAGVTPASLREAGQRAEGIDQLIVDLDVVLATLKQANLLFDAAAWEQLRKVNDQVKAQAKHQPELAKMFEAVTRFFAHGPRNGGTPPTNG